MNWKAYGRKRSWTNLRKTYYSGIFLEGLRKTMEILRIVGVQTEIRAGRNLSTSQKC
jgi:hypothetical protein